MDQRRAPHRQRTARQEDGDHVGPRLAEHRAPVGLLGRPVDDPARVPADILESTARGLLSLAEVRLCASVTGPHNLLFTVWLRSVADVQRLEAQLAERLPHLTLLDRAIALRQVKLMRRRVGPGGRAVGVIPLDVWAPLSG
ncbi:Lrp/AsnC ligand binding domain-containing protein [Streptomyces sp. H27-D2]|uniref:Lrp/AsnC ligand binding domain-containing protein n=1 Tax=Streptomyces sp. H27-D2 TaxID=3046304 RepID=UPI002DBB3DB0|nr:hypothetical protein [Streptomyces sp. H27-D2]MEC4015298.1 hypothetical protein [Streptomyces sp. H27-D2]